MDTTTTRPAVSTPVLWTGRVISALPVAMLLLSAAMKFIKPPQAVEGMAKFGYPEHLLLALGIVELVCTLAYVLPPTAVLGAVLLTGYLGGAVATHVRVGDVWIMPVVIGVLLWVGLFLREPRVRALLPLRRRPRLVPSA